MLVFLFSFYDGAAQTDTLTLRQCLRAAQQNAVISSNFSVLNDLTDLKRANVKASNLPALSAYGKAWYQSDAISIPMQGGALEVDRFQYNGGLELDQKLFDGGLAGKALKLESFVLQAESGKIETDLYQLNNTVTDLFFQMILLDRKSGILKLQEEILVERSREMGSAVENGIVKKNDLQKIEAELMIVQQQIVDLDGTYQQLLVTLKVLTGIPVTGEIQLTLGDDPESFSEKSRPELSYFDSETRRLESMAELQKARYLPKLYAYGQAGYSYPGLNFYENQPDYYYVVGARLSWTIFDWQQNKREVEIIRKQKESIAVRQSDFDQKKTIAREKERAVQEKLDHMIALDQEIINKREAVRRGSETALENGTITATDYLEDLNAEIKARIDAESHVLELRHSLILLRLIEGVDLAEL